MSAQSPSRRAAFTPFRLPTFGKVLITWTPSHPAQVEQVRELIRRHPHWSRYRLSRELCALWDWRTATGQWKDMAARTLQVPVKAVYAYGLGLDWRKALTG